MTFEYRDDHQLTLRINRLEPDHPGQTVTPAIWIETSDGFFSRTAVKVPADRVEEVVAGIRDAARTAAKACRCPHPADEHSIYGCADDCACEWMPKRAARQTTGQDDTERTPCSGPVACGDEPCDRHEREQAHAEGEHAFCGEECPAVGQPAEAHDTEARMRQLILNCLTGRAVCPAPRPVDEATGLLDAYRAAVLREAADAIDATYTGPGTDQYTRYGADLLRRMAGAAVEGER